MQTKLTEHDIEKTPEYVEKIKVWDGFVRAFHWTLVLTFFVAYFSTESIGWVHKGFGYAALALILARIVLGFKGRGHTRFKEFVPRPRSLIAYLWTMLRGREKRYIGHNPAGAVMMLSLLLMVAGIGVTGWMMTTDQFWGNGLVETAHVVMVDVTLIMVGIHAAAAAYASFRHKENLVLSMITGYKRK